MAAFHLTLATLLK